MKFVLFFNDKCNRYIGNTTIITKTVLNFKLKNIVISKWQNAAKTLLLLS